MNKSVFWMVIISNIFFLGCSTTESSSSSDLIEEYPPEQGQSSEHYQSEDLTWLDYVDPKADANIAIQNGDFRVFAFAGRARTFPGIEHDISQIQQQCGYQVLANSSDALTLETELSERKKLYQYAATYNQIVSSSCYKKSNRDGHN